jgi:hypothetical protein
MVVFGGDSGHNLLDDTKVIGFFSVTVWIRNSALSGIMLFFDRMYHVIHQVILWFPPFY